MPYEPKTLQARLTSAAPDLDLTFRSMFGGIMAYADGKPFAVLCDVGLALKLSGSDYTDLLAVPGAKPLQYTPDMPPSKSYVVVPDALLADHAAFRLWIIRG